MNHRMLTLIVTTLALAPVACGGSEPSPQSAQNAGTTTTTSYSEPVPSPEQTPISPLGEPRPQAAAETPGASSTGMRGMADQPAPVVPPTTDTTGGATTGTASTSGPTDTTAPSDGQISGVLDAANTGEISQAKLAIKNAKDQRVKTFAQHMVIDHERAESSLRSVLRKDNLTLQNGPLSDQIKSGSERVMATLRSETGADFDRSYIDAQVDQHQKVLDAIDRFRAQTSNADLKSVLDATRARVAAHLGEARDIQSSLAK
jgi:putative membrane protein